MCVWGGGAFRNTHTSETVKKMCSGGQGVQMSRRYGSKWHTWHHVLLAGDLTEIWQQVDGSSALHGLQRTCQKAVVRDYDVTRSLFDIYRMLLSIYCRIRRPKIPPIKCTKHYTALCLSALKFCK